MSRLSRCAVLWATATLVAVALVDGVAARGGGRGGGGRGGGGFSRGGGGFTRGGPAAWGSFAQNRPTGRVDRGEYDARGPAADGSFGTQYPDRGEREERREERQDRREERREDWREYAEDHYDDDFYGGYYEEEGALVYWTLPCNPNVIAFGGTIYYVCDSTWYIRAFSDGDVVYTVVPAPSTQQ